MLFDVSDLLTDLGAVPGEDFFSNQTMHDPMFDFVNFDATDDSAQVHNDRQQRQPPQTDGARSRAETRPQDRALKDIEQREERDIHPPAQSPSSGMIMPLPSYYAATEVSQDLWWSGGTISSPTLRMNTPQALSDGGRRVMGLHPGASEQPFMAALPSGTFHKVESANDASASSMMVAHTRPHPSGLSSDIETSRSGSSDAQAAIQSPKQASSPRTSPFGNLRASAESVWYTANSRNLTRAELAADLRGSLQEVAQSTIQDGYQADDSASPLSTSSSSSSARSVTNNAPSETLSRPQTVFEDRALFKDRYHAAEQPFAATSVRLRMVSGRITVSGTNDPTSTSNANDFAPGQITRAQHVNPRNTFVDTGTAASAIMGEQATMSANSISGTIQPRLVSLSSLGRRRTQGFNTPRRGGNGSGNESSLDQTAHNNHPLWVTSGQPTHTKFWHAQLKPSKKGTNASTVDPGALGMYQHAGAAAQTAAVVIASLWLVSTLLSATTLSVWCFMAMVSLVANAHRNAKQGELSTMLGSHGRLTERIASGWRTHAQPVLFI